MAGGSEGRIAFVRRLPRLGWQVFTMRPGGTQAKQLTGHEGQGECYRPAWSPDGERLCYVSRRDGYGSLYAMNSNGLGEERLTPEGGTEDDFPAWSPDGERIVFSRGNAVGADALFVLGVATGATRQLTEHQGLESSPAWSPDGRFIAFRRAFGYPPGICVMPAEGGEAWFLLSGDEPAWSPDGRWLAYAQSDSIWVALVDQEACEVQTRARLTDGGDSSDRHPSWSPDGQQIVFEREPLTDTARTSQVVAATADGTEVTTLAVGREPDWSPLPADSQ